MRWHQKNLNEEKQQQEAEVTEANPAYHCHGYSQAYENRKREQHQARRKLCVASVICIFFMIAEITGEYVCSKRSQFGAQHSRIHALLYALWQQGPTTHWGEPTWDKITLLSLQPLKELWGFFKWNFQNIFIYPFKDCIWIGIQRSVNGLNCSPRSLSSAKSG